MVFLESLDFVWTRHLPESCVTHWPLLAQCTQTITRGFDLTLPHSLTWTMPNLQQRQLGFLLPVRRQGRSFGNREPWFLNQPHLSCGMRSKMEFTSVKPDLCQSVMPATDRRPFNKGTSAMPEHFSCCQSVLQSQAVPWSSMTGVHDPTRAFPAQKLRSSLSGLPD